ncbi:hypothetical protein MPSYJ_53640 [Mycolicibacterium psychrotolerans]|uniref:Uncharacterized protein n=1 Tax=Mycolicibacterium psychrotolerans TaxID=216929 RepID=A0A7I7MK76_9MYCO|nr:hypothetical protein MPSYJ_53640 [Mycolicibacterium psychrotolerans]
MRTSTGTAGGAAGAQSSSAADVPGVGTTPGVSSVVTTGGATDVAVAELVVGVADSALCAVAAPPLLRVQAGVSNTAHTSKAGSTPRVTSVPGEGAGEVAFEIGVRRTGDVDRHL